VARSDPWRATSSVHSNLDFGSDTGVFHRNLLDDLRLSLEKLLRSIFGNQKSLENQSSDVGAYIKSCGGSPELANMFVARRLWYGALALGAIETMGAAYAYIG
jgi:hypothetical protein